MKVKKARAFNIIENKDGKIKLKFDNSKEFIEQYDEITPFLLRKGDMLKILHTENNNKDNIQ